MEKSMLDIFWVLVCTGLVFLMQAGFLCLESGLTRSKNAINVAIKNLTGFGISAILFWLFGFAIMFGLTNNGGVDGSVFMFPTDTGTPWMSTFFIYQTMLCATLAAIVSGAVAERMRFRAYIVATVIVSGVIYPIFGRWAWGGVIEGLPGWLAHRGFVDFAGSTVVHSVGGWAALAALLIIGSRSGRFPDGAPPQKIPASNLPLAILGVLLLFFGWFGFNGGNTWGMNGQVPRVIVNTSLAGVSGMITTLTVGWMIKRVPDVTLPMNGAVAGLVAISASCFAVSSLSAVIIGAVGGLLVLVTDFILVKNKVDDAINAVPVHLAAGIWGTIAVAIFGDLETLGTGLSRGAQLLAQILGVGVCGIFSFSVAFVLLKTINHYSSLRVTFEEEQKGLNVAEHNEQTALVDLLGAMEHQYRTRDLNYKVPVEPFTEIGQIAEKYNQVIYALSNREKDLEKLSVITEKNPCSIIVTNVNGDIEYVNNKFCEKYGYTKEEVMGKNPRILKSDLTSKETYVKMWKTITAGNVWRGELCNVSKGGDQYWEDVIISPLLNKKNEVINYVAIKEDITELKSKVEDLERYRGVTVGREFKMIELKNEINALNKKLGKKPPYDTDFKSTK